MPKKAGLIIGAVVIIVVLAAFFMIQKSNPAAPSESADSTQKESSDSLNNFAKGSIASLLTAGKNVTCSLKYPEGKGTGTVFVSGKKVRGDFTTATDAAKEFKTSMIQDGEYAYIWSDADKKGTKIKVSGLPSPSPVANSKTDTSDINQEVDLSCSTWSADPSKFAVPADVEFTDVSALMEKSQGQLPAGNSTPTSPCDAITDPQNKAACISAMSGQQ